MEREMERERERERGRETLPDIFSRSKFFSTECHFSFFLSLVRSLAARLPLASGKQDESLLLQLLLLL